MKGCGRVGEAGKGGMDGQRDRCGPYATQYVQHSLTGTVQSSTRGLSSLVPRFPFCPIPPYHRPFYPAALFILWPSIIIIDILYRGLYFIHVSHRGMRLFGILCASPPLVSFSPPVLFFPSSSLFFFLRRLFDQRENVFFFPFWYNAFFWIWLWCRNCGKLLRERNMGDKRGFLSTRIFHSFLL